MGIHKKFNIGDRVKLVKTDARYSSKVGDIGIVREITESILHVVTKGKSRAWHIEFTKLETEKSKVVKRTFKQLKATPDVESGALWQEDCEDGTQPYSLITKEHYKGTGSVGNYTSRTLVEDQPEWFEEVFKVTPEYMTAPELQQWEDFKSTKKAVAKTAKKNAGGKSGKTRQKYPWLSTLEVGESKRINRKDQDRILSAAYKVSKKSGNKYSVTKVSNYSADIKRVA